MRPNLCNCISNICPFLKKYRYDRNENAEGVKNTINSPHSHKSKTTPENSPQASKFFPTPSNKQLAGLFLEEENPITENADVAVDIPEPMPENNPVIKSNLNSPSSSDQEWEIIELSPTKNTNNFSIDNSLSIKSKRFHFLSWI